MADDTRKPQDTSTNYATFPAAENTDSASTTSSINPGGRPTNLSIIEAAKTIKLEDFKEVHKKPCVRNALLAGILGGFGVGGVRGILGASLLKASHWAVGSFCLTSLLMHEFCQFRRRREKQLMKRAVEVMDRKREKFAKAQEEARIQREEARAKAEELRRSKSWRFW
ncbi:MAG: hypothetical protein M1829_002545 [Trizodia sp. TS-e1964]|nr:MAG: hypothetical protein M1829_002545 [Trizodia sp. TS-e1964]